MSTAKQFGQGRAPRDEVVSKYDDHPPECYLCTWQPAPRRPGYERLKLVHAACSVHHDLPTVAA